VIRRFVGLLLIPLSALAGAMIGSKLGESVCGDRSDALLRCFDQSMLGLMVGFFVGGVLGVVGAVALLRKRRPEA
jgi:hypothetical protein